MRTVLETTILCGNDPIGRVPFRTDPPTEPVGKIDCCERLGGLLRHYYRKAA